MDLKKIIVVCIALMILTPSFSFAIESEPSDSSSGSYSVFDLSPFENNQVALNTVENSDNYDVSDSEETNPDALLQEENLENLDTFEAIMPMATGITTIEPDADLSSLTALQSADLAFSKDAYLTSLFSGAAVYNYPIDVPKGIAGFQPKIELSYNSQSVGGTYGWLGDGWSLNEFYILRDVNYTPNNISDDRFKLMFDGQIHNLIYSKTDGFYHTEIETYMKIQKETGGSNLRREYWTVTTKDGTEYRFGATSDSELLNSVSGRNYVTKWKLDQIKDVNGNLITYNYVKNPVAGEISTSYLNNISYNNGFNVIEFERTGKPVTFTGYKDGSLVPEKCLLSAVSIKAEGQLIYQYQLSYVSDNHVLLDSITLVGTDSISLPATTFSYGANGDFVLDSSWEIPQYFTIRGYNQSVQIVDINGDGLPDILHFSANNYKTIWINTGNGFVRDSSWELPEAVTFTGNDRGFRFVDLNGDGFLDIVQSYYSGTTRKQVWINTGSGFVLNSSWSIPVIISREGRDQGVQFVDINGDGLPDIVQSCSYGTTRSKGVWLNTGSGFVSDSSWSIPTDISIEGRDQGVRFVDINGDGLPDIVQSYSSSPSSGASKKVWINTGSGFVLNSSWSIPVVIIAGIYDQGVRFVDINGDGLPDIVQSYSPNTSTYKGVWMNTGSGFVSDSSWSILPHITDRGGDAGVRLFDINGDGLPDLVQSLQFQNGNLLTQIKNVWINSPDSTPNLLTQINHSSGAVTKIEYDTSTRYNNTQENGKQGLPNPIKVVKNVEIDNGMQNGQKTVSTLTYDYKGGFMHFEPKGRTEFRGFREVTVTDGRTVTEHYFHQDDAQKGKEYLTITKSTANDLYSKTENNFIAASAGGIFEVLLNNTSTSLYDGQTTPVTTKINYEFDTYGNVISIFNEGDLSIKGDENTVWFEYTYNTSNWILNKVKRETITDSNLRTMAEVEFYYDGHSNLNDAPTRGLITETISWNNEGEDIVKEFDYDSFGNFISKTDGCGHTTMIEYGLNPIFPISFTNALGQTTLLEYNLSIGKLEKTTDPNGFKTSVEYDSLGRITKVIKPGDISTSPTIRYRYFIDGKAPEYIQISTKKQGNEYYEMWNYYDGLKRIIKTESDSDIPSQKIITETYYDDYGGVSKVIAPRKGNEPILETVNQYDSFGRLIQVTNPDGSSRQVEYNQFRTVSFDENGHKIQVDKDVYGNIIQVTEFNSNEIYETRYEYDAMGRLVKIIPNQYYDQSNIALLVENLGVTTGNLKNTELINLDLSSLGSATPINTTYQVENTTFVYDSLGRQIMMDDPDLGVWTYTYTPNNKIASQTDARGVTIEYEYDVLDRLTLINYPNDDDVIYEYDNDTIGTLSKVSSGMVTKSYDYDSRLRIVKEVVSIEGTENSNSCGGDLIEGAPLSVQSNTIHEETVDVFSEIFSELPSSSLSVQSDTIQSNTIHEEVDVAFSEIQSLTLPVMTESDIGVSSAPRLNTNGFFENQQDITLQLEEEGYRIQRVDLTNLRVSMGAKDIGYIYLNERNILKFVDSSSGGDLYIYDEAGNKVGNIAKINGKTSAQNMTFDVSFIHDGAVMCIEIQKYSKGVLNGTFSYSYLTDEEILTLRAHLDGYQSGVDYISSGYVAEYEALMIPVVSEVPELMEFIIEGSFENQQDITLQLKEEGDRVQRVDLKNLRVSMGAKDIGYIYLNDNNILKFVDSGSGGNLYIYDEAGNQLGNIAKINGKPSAENMIFDVSFIHDGSVMRIEIQKYSKGVLNGTFSYSYLTDEDILTLRAYLAGYQSGVDYISSGYVVEYEALTIPEVPMVPELREFIIDGSFENQQDITFQLKEEGYRVQRVDLKNLRVSMGSGDSGYIYLNGHNILKFNNTSSGGNLLVYDQNGKQLGNIAKINGKPPSGNMTFDISFIVDGFKILVEIQKYNGSLPDGTFSYSFLMDGDLTLRAQLAGYQSNVDYISSEYTIYYEPLPVFSPSGTFENEEHTFIPLYQKGLDLTELHLTNLRVPTGVHDIGSVYLNDWELLRFIDTPAGGTLIVFDENGNELDFIDEVNGRLNSENVTLDISLVRLDETNLSITLNKKENGSFAEAYSYVCPLGKPIVSAQLYLCGYESNTHYISGAYDTVYVPSLEPLGGSFENEEDITISFEKEDLDVKRLDLKNLRVSMRSKDIGYIYLNDRESLKFVSDNNVLYICNENGLAFGQIVGVNGRPSTNTNENMTFDISFVSSGSDTLIKIEKFGKGQLNSTNYYSYTRSEPISSMRAYLYGYQSNADYINCSYDVDYEAIVYDLPAYEKPDNRFENEGDITIFMENNIYTTVKQLNLDDLRMRSNVNENVYISLNDNDILRFENTASIKSLFVLDSNGNTIDVIGPLNNSEPYENTTFNVSFIRDNQTTYQTTIYVETTEKGVVTGTYQYVYDLNDPFLSLRAYVDTYESEVSFISSSYGIFYSTTTNHSPENDIPSDFITHYSYDSMDRITQKTLPNGKVITYNYNNQTLLSSIPGVVDNIEYNSMNLMTRKAFSNNVATDLTYDGWTKRLENINTPGLQNIDYTFDLKGNIVGITDNVINENQYFFYDDLDRLILAGSENYSQSFAYNPLGSILAHRNKDMTTNEEIIFGFEYGKNAGIHAPTRVGDMELLYDANGNLIEDGEFIYVYNDANRLTEVLKKSDNDRAIAEFVYDENGKRVKKVENDVVSYYISSDYDIKDGEETVYFFANGKRVAKESSEGMFWYLDDHLGSTNVMIDSDGELVERTLYYPFGGHREGGTEQYTFTGKEFDSEIGLYYFEARYYNPQTFVFTQADSVIPNYYNPQALNRYSYCYNNPLKYEDPDGHNPLYYLAGAVAGAVVLTGAGIGGVVGWGAGVITGLDKALVRYYESENPSLVACYWDVEKSCIQDFVRGTYYGTAVTAGAVGTFMSSASPSTEGLVVGMLVESTIHVPTNFSANFICSMLDGQSIFDSWKDAKGYAMDDIQQSSASTPPEILAVMQGTKQGQATEGQDINEYGKGFNYLQNDISKGVTNSIERDIKMTRPLT